MRSLGPWQSPFRRHRAAPSASGSPPRYRRSCPHRLERRRPSLSSRHCSSRPTPGCARARRSTSPSAGRGVRTCLPGRWRSRRRRRSPAAPLNRPTGPTSFPCHRPQYLAKQMNSLSADVSAGGHLRSQAAGRAEAGSVVRLRVAIVVAGLVLGAALMLSAGTSAAPDGEDPRAGGPGSEAAGSTGAAALRSKFALANRCFALAPRATARVRRATADGYRVGSPRPPRPSISSRPASARTCFPTRTAGSSGSATPPSERRRPRPSQPSGRRRSPRSGRVSFRSTVDRTLARRRACEPGARQPSTATRPQRPLRAPARGQLPPVPRGRARRRRQAIQGHQPRRHRARLRRHSISTSPPRCAPAARSSTASSFDRFGITEALGHDAELHGADGSDDVTGNLLRDGLPFGTHDTARLADLRRLAGERHEHAPAGLLRVAGADVEGGRAARRCAGGRGPTDVRDRAAKGALL